MTRKQLFEFEKAQIVTYNDCGLSLYNMAEKLNHYQSSIRISNQGKENSKKFPIF